MGLEHGSTSPNFWFKVDVIHMLEVLLMHPRDASDHHIVGHVEGTCTLGNWKFVKLAS